ncbi:MAG: dipeptidase PepE, partial [Blastocatellia bacterium]
ITGFLGNVRRILFVPFAMYNLDAYSSRSGGRLKAMGFDFESVHTCADPNQVASNAEAIFIGGGNTFRLLNGLYSHDLLDPIRKRIKEGAPYIGSSAGSIVAGPTLKTTKDMPIVQPPSFNALGLVAFQISPHYLDPDPSSTHMGETQEERINQFLEENDAPVVGLREGTMLRVEGRSIALKGTMSARIFRRGHDPVEVQSGSELSDLISADQENGQ